MHAVSPAFILHLAGRFLTGNRSVPASYQGDMNGNSMEDMTGRANKNMTLALQSSGLSSQICE